jgi:DnaJ-class molecular chaperone
MAPGTATFYQVLGITQQATTQEIKDAYRRQAIRMHPDKDCNNPKAKENFQKVLSPSSQSHWCQFSELPN